MEVPWVTAELPHRRRIRPSHVRYIDKSGMYYAARGCERPYEWAAYDAVPFTRLRQPLDQARVAVVTTSFITRDDKPHGHAPRDKIAYAQPVADRPRQMFTADLFWDKQSSHTNDLESFLPLKRLEDFDGSGRIGSLNLRFFGVPTSYSQRRTLLDADKIARWCSEDSADAAMLVRLGPVCHQTVRLVARTLEEAGIATVVVGSARDIVEECGVPRFLFVDFPLGNPCGKPQDQETQTAIVGMALDLLESAVAPRTTVQAPFRWGDDDWSVNCMAVCSFPKGGAGR